MSYFVFRVEISSVENYTFAVAAESEAAARAKIDERYPGAPYIGFICETQIFE